MHALSWLLAPLLVAVPVRAREADTASWVGKTVFMRVSGLSVQLTQEPSDDPVSMAPANAVQYRVLDERPRHVQVKTREGHAGWLAKTDVIPLEDAIPFFTKQIEANRNDAGAYTRRASAYRSQGDFENALKDASEAVRMNPHAANYNNRALVFNAMRDFDKAIADYAQAISQNPQYALAHINRASMWNNKKDYDRAIADTTQALQWEPKNPNAYRLRGLAYHGKKQCDRAIEELTRSLEIDPKSSQARADRAQAYAARNDHEPARDDFNEAIRLEPTNVAALTSAALLLASCPEAKYRDGKRALELALNAHRQELNNSAALEALAAAYAELGRFDEAVAWQEHALHDRLLATEARARLELYRLKKPYRQAPA